MQQTFPCPTCGVPVSIGQRVCAACGERFEYRCAHCGATAGTVSNFCTQCGMELYRQTPLTAPSPAGYRYSPAYQEANQRDKSSSSMGLAGAMLASIAVILLLGTIFYGIATNSQIEPSDRLSGGFLFEETHSASTSQSTPPPESPPASPAKPPPDMEAEPDPEPVPDLPVYTTEEVMALANSFSPECKALPSGVG